MKPEINIRAANLKVQYAQNIALDINALELRGNIIAIIGQNGSGKSTLIKTILNLLYPKTGQLALILQNDSQLLIPQKDMAFSPETGAIFSDISVEEYLQLWSRLKHKNKDHFKKEGKKYLELFEIAPFLKKLGRELSKGQRRRVQIVAGFICQPKLFLFDEPFDGLDITQTNNLVEILQQESKNMSLIISSHRMEIVERLADQVIVLNHGHLVTAGSIAKVSVDLCKNLGKNDLEPFVEEEEINSSNMKIQKIAPSLLEAMHYYLQSQSFLT